jgi:hypothetical protein
MTSEEMETMLENTSAIHKTWWELVEFFEEKGRDIRNLAGYEDIQLMNEFCKTHPEVIKVHVDDSYHCNSYVYLIPHESDTDYMGTTCIFIPQCCGEINQFFLYPNDHRQMYHAMLELERKFKEKGDERWRAIYGELDE